MWLTETEFHQKMRNIKFLIYFTFPQASLPSMSAQMRWVRGIGVTTVGRHGSQFFALIAPHPEIGDRNREGRMLANVFSNTTPRRVGEAEGVPLLGFALSLCLMAAIAALAFVACAAL